MNNINDCAIQCLTRIGIEKDWRKSGKMTSFDPSETDYGYPLYTYGQYYGGYPLYTHPPTLASRSVVESVPLSVTHNPRPRGSGICEFVVVLCATYLASTVLKLPNSRLVHGRRKEFGLVFIGFMEISANMSLVGSTICPSNM